MGKETKDPMGSQEYLFIDLCILSIEQSWFPDFFLFYNDYLNNNGKISSREREDRVWSGVGAQGEAEESIVLW